MNKTLVTIDYEGQEVEVSQEVAAFLEADEKRQAAEQKRDRRHLTDKPLDVLDRQGDLISAPLEDEVIDRMAFDEITAPLTAVQKRRVKLNLEYGLTCEEIAAAEGVHKTVVAKSIRLAKEKIKKL